MESISAYLASLTLTGIVSMALPVIFIVVVGLLIIKAVMKLVDRALAKSRLENAATGLVKSLLKVVLYVLLGLMVADKLGIDVTGVVALASVASLALSLALQDALTNVIGGFTLLSNHPFKAGDLVEIAGQTGVVQTIELNYTKLVTGDNKVISIPNSAVVAAQIVNYSTAGTRRVDIAVSASYDSPVETVKDALITAARVPTVLETPVPFAAVSKYGDSAIEYILQVWTTSDDYWTTLFTVNENIKDQFDANGVQFTFPHVTVHMDK